LSPNIRTFICPACGGEVAISERAVVLLGGVLDADGRPEYPLETQVTICELCVAPLVCEQLEPLRFRVVPSDPPPDVGAQFTVVLAAFIVRGLEAIPASEWARAERCPCGSPVFGLVFEGEDEAPAALCLGSGSVSLAGRTFRFGSTEFDGLTTLQSTRVFALHLAFDAYSVRAHRKRRERTHGDLPHLEKGVPRWN
jgi:hypothetical protein